MSPSEALAVTDEPNWRELWKVLRVADDGFEVILTKWRRWHWTPGIEYHDNYGRRQVRRMPAPAIDAMIALAGLGVMPSRNGPERPPGLFVEQHDDHMWVVTQGRAWRIVGIEAMTMHLDSFGEARQIDMSKALWDKYVEGHAALLTSTLARLNG